MDPLIYEEITRQETNHWWFRARRAITFALLSRLPLPPGARILDAGCGSGGNLPMLSSLTPNLYAFELNNEVRATAYRRGLGQVEAGQLPGYIPYAGTNFDLITLFDVLEHIEDDKAALAALAARLNPGGFLFLTVPAFKELFGPLDELHHHFRRYSWKEIKQLLEEAGLEVSFMNYWNLLLFPGAVIIRLIERMKKNSTHAFGVKTPPAFINTLLKVIVSCERFIIPHLTLPFGLSIIAIARKAN